MSPQTLPSARLRNISRSFHNYHFKKIEVHYRTKQGTTQPGTVGLFFYDDPGTVDQTASASPYTLEAQILESDQGMLMPCWSNFSLKYKGKSFRSAYRCSAQSGEIEDCVQALLVTAVEIPSGLSGGASVGLLELDYEIEFTNPKSVPVTSSDMEKPYAVWEIGSNMNANIPKGPVSWVDPVTATVNTWLNNEGLYLCTFVNEHQANTANWQVVGYPGQAYYVSIYIVYDLPLVSVKFTFYDDYGSYLANQPLQSSAEWPKFMARVNLHQILDTTDVNTKVALIPGTQRTQSVGVGTNSVIQSVNRQVYVDNNYYNNDLTRNPTSYL